MSRLQSLGVGLFIVAGIAGAASAQDAEPASPSPTTPPAAPAAASAPAKPATSAEKTVTLPSSLSPQSAADLSEGAKLRYGLSLSLLRLSFSRQDDEAARVRNYSPKLERIAPEIGFQFAYAPPSSPFRIHTTSKDDDGTLQLMSFGGAFLVRLSDQDVSRGGISLAVIMGFFDDAVSMGIGVDIYRGIPVAGADGSRGGATAYTGLASWAFAREGELTPENVFLVFSVNLAKLSGEK